MIERSTVVQVRPMRPVDVPAVVEWHLQNFPHCFYSRLGPDFMVSDVREHLKSPAVASFSAVDPRTGLVIGYLLGSLDDERLRTHKARHAASPLARASAAALRRRPGLWGEFLRVWSLWYLRRLARGVRAGGDTRGERTEGEMRSAELLSICVAPGHRLRGAGAALHDTFLQQVAASGASRVHLVNETVNTVATGLYQRRGWTTEDEATSRDGRRLVRMVKCLDGTERR